jgi:hypothetical protein
MTTKYSDIYAFFKDKITDYDLLMYEVSIQDEMLLSLLNQSCAKFQRICKNDLSLKDDVLLEFPFKLSLEEIDILTDWMVEAWLKPNLNNIENMRNHLSTKDFSFFSPANLLDKMQMVYDSARKNARSKMNEYSFINSDLERVKS